MARKLKIKQKLFPPMRHWRGAIPQTVRHWFDLWARDSLRGPPQPRLSWARLHLHPV